MTMTMVFAIIGIICLLIGIYLLLSIEYELSEKKKDTMFVWAINFSYTGAILLYGAYEFR